MLQFSRPLNARKWICAELLISIAHPKFQDQLRAAAQQLFWP
jgi:acyl-CoA hydrolase